MKTWTVALGALAIWATCAGCAQSPQKPLPAIPEAAAFKELSAAWTEAGTSPSWSRQNWWTAYQDAELDALQQQLLENSPDLASALSRYDQARAATSILRAAQAPTVGTSINAQRDRQSELRPLRVLGPNSPDYYNSVTLGLDFQYELDVWGRVRQQVNAGVLQEQAAQADFAGARLSLQSQLADTWMNLRGIDAEVLLLQETLKAYVRANDLIDQRHMGGIASGLDVARAQTQLESTRSQLNQLLARRAVLEHAVAALVGANASAFAVQARVVPSVMPMIPVGLPSALLQRRPDIAAAQRRVAAANASVDVARTAFFPSLTLSASGGYQSSDLGQFISAPNLFWAIGPSMMFTVFDGGRRRAGVARAQAQLEEISQQYRSVVLGAFQQVEDQLALLNSYQSAASDESRAVAAAERSQALATTRYREGAASYLEVVTAQTANLQARRSALDLTTRQRRASVQLIRALGGGWSEDQLAAK